MNRIYMPSIILSSDFLGIGCLHARQAPSPEGDALLITIQANYHAQEDANLGMEGDPEVDGEIIEVDRRRSHPRMVVWWTITPCPAFCRLDPILLAAR